LASSSAPRSNKVLVSQAVEPAIDKSPHQAMAFYQPRMKTTIAQSLRVDSAPRNGAGGNASGTLSESKVVSRVISHKKIHKQHPRANAVARGWLLVIPIQAATTFRQS